MDTDDPKKSLSFRIATTVVIGMGSPFGDDQAGWRLVDMLRRRPGVRAHLKKVHEATQIVDELGGCSKLFIVDACRSGRRVGAQTRLHWPDPHIAAHHTPSTHGVGLCDALRLAEQLGRLPREVEIFGIEVAECAPGHEICTDVLRAVAELEAVIWAEIREAVYA